MEDPLYFAVLGNFEVRSGATIVQLGRPLHHAILGYLLLNANRVVSTERVIEAIWGGVPPDSARTQVHAAISGLRQRLPGTDRLATKGGGYELTVAPGELDLDAFERLRGGDSDEVRSALALWRGEPLCGIRANYVGALRFRMGELRLAAWERLADLELEAGRHEEVIPDLMTLVAAHPLHERLVERLMLALYRAGRQSDALAAGRELRQHLALEQGLDPGQSFTDVERAILNADPALGITVHGRQPAQLPPDSAEFTGRVEQLKELTEQLCGATLAVISGGGGIGKSALAVRWAHEAVSRFPDGQLYVNLYGHAGSPPLRTEVVLGRFLRALGVEADRIPSDVDEAAALYRTLLAGQRMIVVLDDAVDADQVRPLLPGGSSVTLVTSRDSLHGLVVRDSALQLELGGLGPGESRELFAHLLGPERVEKAELAFAAIAEFCGHLPLALRICAAQLADQSQRPAADYLAELSYGDPLATLSIDGDTSSCVRATFDLSYSRRDALEQRLFRLLSLVPGPDFTIEAAAALLGSTHGTTRRLLERLVTAHLLQRPAQGRYSMHDLLSWYAAALVRTSERHEALDRLYIHYLDAAQAAATLLYPDAIRLPRAPAAQSFPDSESALSWLEAERINLVAAIEQSDGPMAWMLADVLRIFFYLRNYPTDMAVAATAALAAATRHADPLGQASGHIGLGQHHRGANPQLSVSHYRWALQLAREHGWAYAVPGLLNNVGIGYIDLGRMQEARDCLSEAVAIHRASGGLARLPIPLSNLGLSNYYLGDSGQAIAELTESLDLYRAAGNRDGEVDALCMFGTVHLGLGDAGQALELACAALDIVSSVDGRMFEAQAIVVKANALYALGERQMALDAFASGLQLATETGDQMTAARAHIGLARAYEDLGRTSLAQSHRQAAADSALVLGSLQLEREMRCPHPG